MGMGGEVLAWLLGLYYICMESGLESVLPPIDVRHEGGRESSPLRHEGGLPLSISISDIEENTESKSVVENRPLLPFLISKSMSRRLLLLLSWLFDPSSARESRLLPMLDRLSLELFEECDRFDPNVLPLLAFSDSDVGSVNDVLLIRLLPLRI